MIGRTVSHYRISEKLGEGGMGVVYKAHDLKLDRFVALKFLPLHLGVAEEENQRFIQEAKAASALEHPNICNIHEIDETEDGQMFICMAYYEGETLQKKVISDQWSVDSAIDIAIQIAQGLAAVHAHGIVHRDIKPANIMVLDDGTVKILDFGLAKLAGIIRIPRASTTIGTPAYISPEQVRGEAVDHRADIWSIGVVLYEILTGQLPFNEEVEQVLMYSILHENPPPLASLRTDVPSDLERIVTQCLHKDQSARYQHADELLADLRQLKKELEAKAIHSKINFTKRRTRFGAGIVGALLLAISGYLAFFSDPDPNPSSLPMKTVRLTSFPGEEYAPTFSPDGNTMAFSWNGPTKDNFDIYIRLVDTGSLRRLTSDAAHEFAPTWSPDGRYLAFIRIASPSSSRGVYVIPALGGRERKLVDAVPIFRSFMCWSSDGRSLFFPDKVSAENPFGICEISIESSERRSLTAPPRDCFGDHTPRLSPDGQTLAFVRSKNSGVEDVHLIPITGGEPRRITFDDMEILGMAWNPDSRAVVFASERDGVPSLWRVSVSGGRPERLGVGGDNVYDPSISLQRNRLAYTQIISNTNIWRVAVADPGEPIQLISSTHDNYHPRFSPDGKKIVFGSNRSESNEIWVCDSDGTNPVQLTSLGGAMTGAPSWSPDGKRIAFESLASKRIDIFVMSAEGGEPRRLTMDSSDHTFPSWSRDGRWVYFSSNRTGTVQVWKVPAEGGEAVQVTNQGGLAACEAHDGKSIYYVKSPEHGGIWKVPIADGEELPVLAQLKAEYSGAWALVENGIYFIDPEARPQATIEFFNFATQRVTQIAVLKQEYTLWGQTGLAASPDEQWILYSQVDQMSSDIILVENFR